MLIAIAVLLALGALWGFNNRLRGIWAPAPFQWAWRSKKDPQGTREGPEGIEKI